MAKPAEWPFQVEFHMAQGIGFRCMAYRDSMGIWRDAFTDEILYGEIQFLE